MLKYYNQFMNGVDRSDQMLSSHNVSFKCYRWWKTFVFHLVDIIVVNGFLLFQKHREANPDDEALRSPSNYSIVEFREASIRQICSWPEYDDPPAYVKSAPGHSQFQTDHSGWHPRKELGEIVLCVIKKLEVKRKFQLTALLPSVRSFCTLLKLLIVLELFTPQVITDLNACS